MKNLQEISGAFHAAYNSQQRRIDAIRAQADKAEAASLRYQRLAARKMGESHRLCSKMNGMRDVHWTDSLIRPLLVEIEERTGWEFDNKDDLRTFGLRGECPAHIDSGETNEYGFKKYKAYIIFTTDLDRRDDGTWHWELRFDTGERVENYPPGSIGELNGFGNKTAKVESVEQIIEFLQKQMDNAA